MQRSGISGTSPPCSSSERNRSTPPDEVRPACSRTATRQTGTNLGRYLPRYPPSYLLRYLQSVLTSISFQVLCKYLDMYPVLYSFDHLHSFGKLAIFPPTSALQGHSIALRRCRLLLLLLLFPRRLRLLLSPATSYISYHILEVSTDLLSPVAFLYIIIVIFLRRIC